MGFIEGTYPKWVTSLVGGNVCTYLERTVVDPKNKFMQLRTKNITCNQILSFEEVCTYEPNKEDPNKTDFRHEVKITSHIWPAETVEKYALGSFVSSAEVGRKVMKNAVKRIPFILQGFPNDESLAEKIDLLRSGEFPAQPEKK